LKAEIFSCQSTLNLVLISPEIAKKVEYDRNREAYVTSTGKKPEEVLKDWEKMSFDEQHQFPKLRRAQEKRQSPNPRRDSV
jgi:hypothetical protein